MIAELQQCFAKLARCLETIFGVLLDGFQEELGDFVIQIRTQVARVARGVVHDRLHHFLRPAAFPGEIADEGFIGRHAEGKHIDAVIGRGTLDNLRARYIVVPVRLPGLQNSGLWNRQAQVDNFDDASLPW